MLTPVESLREGLLAAGVRDTIDDTKILEGYRRDQAAQGLLSAGMPALLVRAVSVADVQATIRLAEARNVPIVTRGAGSGLSGGANAIDGCVVLSTERMTKLLDVDPGALTIRAQAGMLNADVKKAAHEAGLFYAPDPASSEFSTIGGNIATNAGGLCCVKYGVTRDAVSELEVVTADGSVVSLGRPTRKGVAGYDLVSLLCGSEGTLGVITSATMRLLPRPGPGVTLAGSFPSLAGAGRAVERIVRSVTPALLEIMDNTTIAAVEAMAPMDLDLDAGAMLFARSDSAGSGAVEEIDGMARIMEEEGADLVVTSDREAEARMLLAARRLAYPALERQGTTLLDDVAVPVSRVTKFIDAVGHLSQKHGLVIGTFGHAGDGNLHPTIVYAANDPSEAARAKAAFRDIVRTALALGGTMTGEHGVGSLKVDLLSEELLTSHDLHRRIKTALDPKGLLNPGKGL